MIILIGILVFVVVVILFATETITLQPPRTDQIKQLEVTLRADVEQRVRADVFEVVKKVSEQGGYWIASEQPQSLLYRGTDVPYWNLGDQDLSRSKQQVEKELEKGVKVALVTLDAQDLSQKIGKTVIIDPIQRVEVDIQNNFVNFKVHVTMRLEGYRQKSPIEVSIPAKLGEALDFANKLTEIQLSPKEQDTGRFLEKSLILSIAGYQSAAFDGNPKVPSIGILEGCGNFMHRDWFSVRPEMESLIRGTLVNTYPAGQIPEGTEKRHYPSHVLPVHTNMELELSPGEPLDENNFQMVPNPLQVRATSPTFVPICFSNPYVVDYWILLPIVVELRDQDYRFQFVTQVYIVGYEPGDQKDLEINLDSWRQQLSTCENALCDGKIKVQGTEGPVDLATITYSGCNLGLTNKDGLLETRVPCGISMLQISKPGFTPYRELVSSDELQDKIFNMQSHQISTVKINLFNLILQNNAGTYTVKDVVPNTRTVNLELQSTDLAALGVTKYSEITTANRLVTDNIPVGSIIVSATVSEGEKVLGGFLVSYFLPDFKNHELNVYIPMLDDSVHTTKVNCQGLISGECEDKALKAAQEQNIYILSLTNTTIKCREQTGEIVPLSPIPIDINKLKTCSVTL